MADAIKRDPCPTCGRNRGPNDYDVLDQCHATDSAYCQAFARQRAEWIAYREALLDPTRFA